MDRSGSFLEKGVSGVDDHSAVDFEQSTIVCDEGKGVICGLVNDDIARPFHAERRGKWQGRRPVKVDLIIYLGIDRWAAPASVAVIFSQ
jgi:hypothetical protein